MVNRKSWKWVYAYVIAITVDVLDVVAFYVFQMPGVGQMIDIITTLLLAPVLGKYAFITLLELIPFEGFFPTFVLSTVMAQAEAAGKPFAISSSGGMLK